MEHDETALNQLNELLVIEAEVAMQEIGADDEIRNLLTWCTRLDNPRYWEGGHAHVVLTDELLPSNLLDDHGTDGVQPTEKALLVKGLIESLNREELTELTLQLSLCPIHFCDYASCFDDDEPDCAAIRMIHPGHDT